MVNDLTLFILEGHHGCRFGLTEGEINILNRNKRLELQPATPLNFGFKEAMKLSAHGAMLPRIILQHWRDPNERVLEVVSGNLSLMPHRYFLSAWIRYDLWKDLIHTGKIL